MNNLVKNNLSMTFRTEALMSFLIYAALMSLAIGLVSSMTILALSHIFMIVPIIYFLPKAEFKNFPKSSWFLLALGIVIVLSILFNQDIIENGYRNIGKSKYFFLAFFSIAPLSWFFKNKLTDKKLKTLIYAFLIATTLSSLSGMIAQVIGFNPISMRPPDIARNSGLMGMVMNYAHNLSLFLIIGIGYFLRNKKDLIVNKSFLIATFIINLVGLYFSFTRGAWIGFLVALPFLFWIKNKKIFFSMILGGLVLGAIGYFLAGSAVKRADNDMTRIAQWKAALYAFKERPILGYGYLNFEKHSSLIKKKYKIHNQAFAGHAHNNFMEVLGALGILGVMAFLGWLFFWVRESFREMDSITFAFIAAFILGGLTQSTIALGINLFFIMAGYAISKGRELSKKSELPLRNFNK